MSFISKTDSINENCFVLFEKSLLLENGALPSRSTVMKIISSGKCADFFTEDIYGYSALLLSEEVSGDGLELVMLRDFFWMNQSGGLGDRFPHKAVFLASRAASMMAQRRIYTHCPRCGKMLAEHSQHSAKICPECGFEFFPRTEPCIIVLVSKGDEVLLVRNKSFKGQHYGCVSGFIDAGESAEEAVEREVMEETGISVRNVRYAGSQYWPFPDQLMLAFHADYAGGEIRIQEEELDDAQWFRRDSLPVLPNKGSVAWNLLNGYFDQAES